LIDRFFGGLTIQWLPDTMRGELDAWSSFIRNYFVKPFTKSMDQSASY